MERVEEYLEAIYDLQKKGKVAKTGEIAKILKVKPASVTEMLIKLKERGYVDYSPYKGVVLTKSGEEIAEKLKTRYLVAFNFFKFIGVEESLASKLACELEHHMSDEVVEKLQKIFETCKDCKKSVRRLSCVGDGIYIIVSSPGKPKSGEKVIVEKGVAKTEDGTEIKEKEFILVSKF
uniref:Metal-dependent transcriptional regulator n=1 Tax=Archaeoglobus fulgidus TaxID=2234 RepID=A0A7J2TK37_ARCFL